MPWWLAGPRTDINGYYDDAPIVSGDDDERAFDVEGGLFRDWYEGKAESGSVGEQVQRHRVAGDGESLEIR